MTRLFTLYCESCGSIILPQEALIATDGTGTKALCCPCCSHALRHVA